MKTLTLICSLLLCADIANAKEKCKKIQWGDVEKAGADISKIFNAYEKALSKISKVIVNAEANKTTSSRTLASVSKSYVTLSQATAVLSQTLVEKSEAAVRSAKGNVEVITYNCFEYLGLKNTQVCKNAISHGVKSLTDISKSSDKAVEALSNINKATVHAAKAPAKVFTARDNIYKATVAFNEAVVKFEKYCK